MQPLGAVERAHLYRPQSKKHGTSRTNRDAVRRARRSPAPWIRASPFTHTSIPPPTTTNTTSNSYSSSQVFYLVTHNDGHTTFDLFAYGNVTSQVLTQPSAPADATVFAPNHATTLTPPGPASLIATRFAGAVMSQTYTLVSREPDTQCFESPCHAIEVIRAVWAPQRSVLS